MFKLLVLYRVYYIIYWNDLHRKLWRAFINVFNIFTVFPMVNRPQIQYYPPFFVYMLRLHFFSTYSRCPLPRHISSISNYISASDPCRPVACWSIFASLSWSCSIVSQFNCQLAKLCLCLTPVQSTFEAIHTFECNRIICQHQVPQVDNL